MRRSIFNIQYSFLLILILLVVPLLSACGITGLNRTLEERLSIPKANRSDPLARRDSQRTGPRPLPICRPIQVTFETDPVLYAALFGDGQDLIYVTEEDGASTLWIRSLSPARMGLPETRLQGMGRITAPAVSRDGRHIAFVATAHDAKGDIYLLNPGTGKGKPKRLTGRETQDGAPALSPDGKTLYFHFSRAEDPGWHLAFLDLREAMPNPRLLNTDGDGAFPAISPDGRSCAFVSTRDDPAGDIFVLDFESGRITPLTRGPALDLYPTWSPDGRTIYFSSLAADTNGDNRITPEDHAVICRVDTSGGDPIVYPLTSEAFSAYHPLLTPTGLLFLSSRRGTANLWHLPPEGMIPLQKDAGTQMALAQRLSERRPRDDRLSVLAFFKVLEGFPDDPSVRATAAYGLGEVYERMGRREDAVQAYALVVESFENAVPESPLARIRLEAIRGRRAWESAATDPEKEAIVRQTIDRIQSLAKPRRSQGSDISREDLARIQARSLMEQARLLSDLATDVPSHLHAIERLNQVSQMTPIPKSVRAEALFLEARMNSRMGRAVQVMPSFQKVIEADPESLWADRSVEAMLLTTLADPTLTTEKARIEALNRLARGYRKTLPKLAMGAFNRMGDMAFEQGDWKQAKTWYLQVLTGFPSSEETATQTAAARLALAEILYREERFREALDLYQAEMELRPGEDRLYRLARAAYVQKSLAVADHHYLLGEVSRAQSMYADLLREEPDQVRAHRGLIKCAAAKKEIGPTLTRYRDRLKRSPNDPIALYAAGLCLTYLEGKEHLVEARGLIQKAIERQGQVPYFHQTLGYIEEVMETVHHAPGHLEKALLAYQKAYFLNRPEQDPRNRTDLALNLGNIHFLLGQYGKALERYMERLDGQTPFDHPDTEILFYRRLGAAAFQVRDPERPIIAYQKAIALIDQRMNPKRPSEILGQINDTVRDRILIPAQERPETVETATSLAKRQAALHQRLFHVTTRPLGPPPDPRWQAYRDALEPIIHDQEAIVSDLTPRVQKAPGQTLDTLRHMARQAREALFFPMQMVQLKAEMLDRLGLAFQEAGRWADAQAAFDDAFNLNQALGQVRNLAANRRSAAYSAYMAAGNLIGKARTEKLKDAARQFRQVPELIQHYGTAEPKKGASSRPGQGLLNVSVDLSLDKTDASRAVYGFTPEQEKRLAQAFISRIETELGELSAAEEAVVRQLAAYPPEQPVGDGDRYGLSLLAHRGGQLSYALQQPGEAFLRFRRSARLALELKNPVSAALNVENMAVTLSRIPAQNPRYSQYRKDLTALDRQTARLLNTFSDVLEPLVVPVYHNTLGVLLLGKPVGNGTDAVENSARRTHALTEAGTHFAQGLESLDRLRGPKGRKALGLEAALHLNMARVAGALGDETARKTHLKQALHSSQRGLLPQYEWRALAGLGDLNAALAALEQVSLFETGCGPGEIVDAFSPLISAQIREGKTEAAFNLLERISEIERFHRLRPMILPPLTDPEKVWLGRVVPRLMTFERLKTELASAPKGEQSHIRTRIHQERQILEDAMGEAGQDMPFQVRLARSETLRHQVMLLLGLALEAREVAETLVNQSPGPRAVTLRQAYRDALLNYRNLWKKLRTQAGREGCRGLAALFGPDPVEAIDLMEGLPAGWSCVRLFGGKGTESEKAFILTPEDMAVQEHRWDSAIPHPLDGRSVVVYEDPSALPPSLGHPLALSATHLVRSLENQKPFRRRMVTLSSEASVPRPFQTTSLPANATETEILDALPGAQGLLLGGPVFIANPVPTRAGQIPFSYLATGLDKGRAFDLSRFSGAISDVSLVLLPQASIQEAYPLGHLFAIMGAPTLLIPEQPQPHSRVLDPFFVAYADAPVHDALMAAEQQAGGREGWTLVGYWGMNKEEALILARKRFKAYVTEGVRTFKAKEPLRAMLAFDKALNVALETRQLQAYLAQLYTYARESAFAAGRYKEAAGYAGALADLLAQKKPDTREHADALIRLGLVQSRMEAYDQAIPVLEAGVEIMANLELGTPQVEALNDLGVVLENATHYDRALERFQSAADLSRDMNRDELLARQQMRMGRILDMRLSRYATAKQHYMTAYDLYKASGKKASMAQALLDTGRCDRLMGNFQGASDRYQQALALLDPGDRDRRLRANIRMEMANNDWFQARYQDAFKGQREVLLAAQEHQWDLEQVNALNTSGLTWWTLGKHKRALRDLEEALVLARTLKSRQDEVATTLNNMGLVYRDQGDHEKALETLKQALAIDRKIRSKWAIAYDLKNQAITYLRMGQPEAALPLFEAALDTARQIGNRINEAKILAAYGEALAAQNRSREADTVYVQALDLSRAMALRETEWRSLYGLARLRLQQGDRKTARELLYQAVEVIEAMRAEIKLEQLRDGFIADKMDVYETLVGLLVDMKREREAFQVAERSRARNLIDLLGNQRLSLHGAVDQKLYDREKALKTRIGEYEALVAQSRDDKAREVYGKALERTRDAHRDLMLEIQMKNPQLASILSVQPLTLPEVQGLLEPGVGLLVYYLIPDEILCWRITRDSTDLFRTPVGRRTVREAVLDYRRILQNLEPAEEMARQFHEWLLPEPGSRLDGIHTVGIVPHDALHHLSFATLFDGKDYLAERFPLFFVPSASVLRYSMKRRTDEKNTKVLAVGNPDLDNPALDLPFAEREVETIGWNFPDITVLTGKRASEAWVVRHVSDFGIIHLASHGEFDPVNPLFSAVKLAKGDQDDGDLKAAEVFGLDIQAGLVVLSACQTGLGKVAKGDDVIGMNRAFLYAGTHTILSSLWRVSDISTAMLVKQFYREYRSENASRSLQKAMRHVKNRYPHPGYWGAFGLVGDYR